MTALSPHTLIRKHKYTQASSTQWPFPISMRCHVGCAAIHGDGLLHEPAFSRKWQTQSLTIRMFILVLFSFVAHKCLVLLLDHAAPHVDDFLKFWEAPRARHMCSVLILLRCMKRAGTESSNGGLFCPIQPGQHRIWVSGLWNAF